MNENNWNDGNGYKNDNDANEIFSGLEFEDAIPAQYEKKYGGYSRQLQKQLVQLTAFRMSTEAMFPTFETEDEKLNEFLEKRFNDIFTEIDWSSLIFMSEEDNSWNGNSTVVYTKLKNNSFDVFVPNTAITRVSPSGKLNFLQLIKFIEGGDLIRIGSEIRTLKDTSFTFHEYKNRGEAGEDIKKIEGDRMAKLGGKTLQANDVDNDFRKEDFKIEKNTKGFIGAVYFQNIATKDQRGRSDFNKESKYAQMLDKIFVRFHWEIDFNKSKFIQDFETGSNLFAKQWQGSQGRQMVENNFTYRTNNFMSPMGSAGGASQYFETSNQNLLALLQLFNYYLKKYWEECGQHQSGSDIGKQISDFQEINERSAENLRFENKINRRKHGWRELFWRMIHEMDDKELGKFGTTPPGMSRSDIKITMDYSKTEVEKDLIENEIMKMQYNMTDLETSMGKVNKLPQGTNAKKLAEKYVENNTKIIMKQIVQKPVDKTVPNITNPQNKSNNQSDGFRNQLDKKKEGK